MYATDFQFDGELLSSYGLMICSFNGSGSTESIKNGADITLTTVKVPGSNTWNHVCGRYDEALTATFQIAKLSGHSQTPYFDAVEQRAINRWLNRADKFYPFCIIQDGFENIYFNASIFGLTHQEIDQRIDQIIEFSELGENIDNPIRTYSSGMYMRLAFSVAINVDAEILLIDEILAVGDQHFQDKCFDKLEELKNSDKTIVIVTHSLDVVKKLCDRAIWIYKGEFKLDGDPTYVIDEYLKQVEKDHHDKVLRAIKEGTHKVKGVIFIDTPKGFATIYRTGGELAFRGWSISNGYDIELEIYLDAQHVKNVRRTPRPDVYNAYAEEYAGFLEKDQIGWEFTIPFEDIQDGVHHLQIRLADKNEKIIDEKEIEFTIE